MNCPICGRWSPAGSPRCTACGADFKDPDVLALARAPAPATVPADLAAGALAEDRLLGLRGEDVADGAGLRRVGVAGAIALLLGAIPLGEGPAWAAVLPAALGVVGLALACLPRRAWHRAPLGVFFAAGGLAELLFGLTALGEGAWGPTALPLLPWLGVAAAGVGVAVRVLRPHDPHAVWIIVGGAVAYVLGGLLPLERAGEQVVFELRLLQLAGEDESMLDLALTGFGGGSPVVLMAAMQLLPVVALPLAALLAFRRPTGLWDAPGKTVRALGHVIVLWLPLLYAAAAFNLAGWAGTTRGDDLETIMLGRARLALLATGAMLWLTGAATTIYVRVRARSTRTGSAR